jgi:two-component system, OmpR family, sensor kinase
MASIRARLTGAYAVTMVATVATLGTVLYAAQQGDRARQLTRQAHEDADLAVRIVGRVAATGEPVTATSDPLLGSSSEAIHVVTPALRNVLEGLPDYVLVLDSGGRTLYNSFAVRQLDGDDQVQLSRLAIAMSASASAHAVRLSDKQLLLAVNATVPGGTAVARVVAGVDLASADPGPTDLRSSALVLAPLVVLLSMVGAYVIAGRAFRPVDVIINEVQAISDGRSLHRRLAVDGAGDELMRLNETLNEMIARLETSFGALRRFTADASHELKTPLTVLRADVERAMSALPQSTEQMVALEEALQETRRMADLVDSLLTLARADEGRFDVVREPVALEPLVREVFESAVILGEDAGLTVSLPVVEAATVLGDAPRLRQLCMNLVMNAVKYTPRGGRIDVSLSHRLDGVTFSVRDTGVGIAATDLPHIFERFWRADRVRSRGSERGGFGLGLAISQWIAQAHGGSITATSRLGRGSIFTVQLPGVGDGASASVELVPGAMGAPTVTGI